MATVYIARVNGQPSRFAIYSAELGSPAGTTTGGDFPLLVLVRAGAVPDLDRGCCDLGPVDGCGVLPEAVDPPAPRAPAADAPLNSCEYVDGAGTLPGLDQIGRVASLGEALDAMRTPLDMAVGGTLDCGGARPCSSTVGTKISGASRSRDRRGDLRRGRDLLVRRSVARRYPGAVGKRRREPASAGSLPLPPSLDQALRNAGSVAQMTMSGSPAPPRLYAAGRSQLHELHVPICCVSVTAPAATVRCVVVFFFGGTIFVGVGGPYFSAAAGSSPRIRRQTSCSGASGR